MSLPEVVSIDCSTNDLRDIYNQLSPDLLQKFLKTVKLCSVESIDTNNHNIKLTSAKDGHYWVIDIPKNSPSNTLVHEDYLLLPNKNEIQNLLQDSQKYEFESLFEFSGKQSQRFNLIQPAIVAQASSEEERWEVKEKGVVQFIDDKTGETEPSKSPNYPEPSYQESEEKLIYQNIINDLLKRIENIEQNYITREEFEELKQDLSKKYTILPSVENVSQLELYQTIQNSVETDNHKFSDEELSVQKCSNFSSINNKISDINRAKSTYTSRNTLEQSILKLVNIYNDNPKSLLLDALCEVSETSQSIDNRRLGYNQPVALEKVSRNKGIAWVINIDGSDYLVPKLKLKINGYNYETIESLFICHGYELGVSYEFILIKPAKLLAQEKGERWELSEKGELQFQTQSS